MNMQGHWRGQYDKYDEMDDFDSNINFDSD